MLVFKSYLCSTVNDSNCIWQKSEVFRGLNLFVPKDFTMTERQIYVL